ncbi:MAG TPA: phosphotransferase [Blastocatellia bacterium]|nr:phosphotransferase [Blastocatellia bacterium]
MATEGQQSNQATLESSLIGLAAQYIDSPLPSLRLTRVTGDASTRCYFRVREPESGASVILALYDRQFDGCEPARSRLARLEQLDPSARLTFANDPCAHVETTGLLRDHGLPAPAVLGVFGPERVVVMEDVGDTRLQDWLAHHNRRDVTTEYRRALAMVVTIQELTGQVIDSPSICSELAFDEAKLGWELEFFLTNYFGQYLNGGLAEADAAAIREDFGDLCDRLARRPRVLVHRDYHARNLMIRGDEMFIIDHQDARMGPASYDVTSLLNDPYAPLDSGVKADLLAFFLDAKARSSLRLPDGFEEEFELMTVQRMLKAVGTYAFQCAVKKNDVYVPYIQPALESALRSIDALGCFPRTRRVLERNLGATEAHQT